jgi:hypothetical protein
MKSLMPLVICASLFALSGCGSTTTPAPSLNGPSAVVTRNGVKLSLKLDRAVYKKDQPVWADVLIENTGSDPVLWVGGGCAVGAHVTVQAANAPGVTPADAAAAKLRQRWQEEYRRDEQQRFTDESELEAQKKGLSRACTTDVRNEELKPGASIHYRGAWDQQLSYYPNKLLASPGRYTVEATFPMGSYKALDPVAVRAEVELAGDRPKLIDRIQALDAALADTRVMDWLLAHSGDGVARQENGQWLLRDGDKWIPAGEQLGKSEAAGTPDGSAAFRDGKWIVHLVRKSGPEPHVVDATVHAETSRVENVTFINQGK